jgi:hypothetical protein
MLKARWRVELLETKPLLLCKPPIVRQSGIHVSDIIRSLVDALEGKQNGEKAIPDDVRAKMEAGFAAETALETGYRANAPAEALGERLGEIEYEGVWGSPDGVAGLAEGNSEIVLDEIKCTWMSSRKTKPHEVRRYTMQTLAYCKMLSEVYGRPCRTIRYWMFYVNGDYIYPLRPQPIRYTYVVSLQEIEENWSILINHKRRMEATA